MINFYESCSSNLLGIQIKTYDKNNNGDYQYIPNTNSNAYINIKNTAYSIVKVEVNNFNEYNYINKALVSLPIDYNTSQYQVSIFGVQIANSSKRSQIDELFNTNSANVVNEIMSYKTEHPIDVATKKFAGSPDALKSYRSSSVSLNITSYFSGGPNVSEYYIV